MDQNFQFTAEDEAALACDAPGSANIARLFYSEEKGNSWHPIGKDKFRFTGEGTNMQFRIGRLFWVQILEWTSPQKMQEKSIKLMAFCNGNKWPYVMTFSSAEERDTTFSQFSTVIANVQKNSNILIDTEVTYISDAEPDGITGTLNVTKTGLIFMTPTVKSIANLLINMNSFHEINPKPIDENIIELTNINAKSQTGFPIRLRFDKMRDSYLEKIKSVIKQNDIHIKITMVKPESFTHKAEQEENQDQPETGDVEEGVFTEFPSFVLEGLMGEENDENIFNEQSKVFITNKDKWEFFGTGEFHINYTKEGKYRIVMRRGVAKLICLNMLCFKEMNLKIKSTTQIQFLAFVNEQEKPRSVLIEFKNSESCYTAHFIIQSALAV